MVNRINEILNRYNLTAAKFADKLEVPRSTISHILSERNKPSLEFIQKVLTKYPEINTNWLIKGEGGFYKKGEPDLFSQLEEVDLEKDEKRQDHDADEKQFISAKNNNTSENETEPATAREKEKYENLSDIKTNNKQPESIEKLNVDKQKEQIRNRSKKVKKIIVFYDDNTFEEFLPSHNSFP